MFKRTVIPILCVLAGAAAIYVAITGAGPLRNIAPPDDSLHSRRSDANLLAYREVAPIATEMQSPRGIAVDSAGRIYVAGDSLVKVFQPDGAKARQFATGAGASAIAVAADGKVYVAMGNHVEVHDPRGARLADWNAFDGNCMFSSVAAGEGGVFLADDYSASVLRLDAGGAVIARIGRGQTDESILLRSPHFDVALGPEGNLLRMTNPGRLRVDAYTLDGQRRFAWGKATAEIDGFSGCCNPKDIAILPDGGIVTSEKGLPRVKVHNRDGTFQCVVAGTESFDRDVAYLDLAADRQGRIFVLDPSRKTVRVFVRKGYR
jgi:hypothetical protein